MGSLATSSAVLAASPSPPELLKQKHRLTRMLSSGAAIMMKDEHFVDSLPVKRWSAPVAAVSLSLATCKELSALAVE